MSPATAIDPKQYGKLLTKALPSVIRTEEQNAHYFAKLERLASKAELTPEQRELMELLTVLIQQFEEAHYALPASSPVSVILHLMEANGLRQKDLAPVFGTPSIVSDVLHGKRGLTLKHIRNLSERFHVAPEVFLSDALSLTTHPAKVRRSSRLKARTSTAKKAGHDLVPA